jgi:hypothetical protein
MERKGGMKKIIIILALGAILVLGVLTVAEVLQRQKVKNVRECVNDADCVPAACCHPSECIAREKAPSCEGIMCTMACQSILDCGNGYCGCVQGKCKALAKS